MSIENSNQNAPLSLEETAEQRQAFDLYLGMGQHRSLRKVSDAVGKHRVTVEGWSSQFNWVDRVKKMEDQGDVETQIALDYQRREKMLNILDDLVCQFEDKVKNKEIKLESPADFQRVVNMITVLTPRYAQATTPSTEAQGARLSLLEGKSKDEILITVQTTLEAIQRMVGPKGEKRVVNSQIE